MKPKHLNTTKGILSLFLLILLFQGVSSISMAQNNEYGKVDALRNTFIGSFSELRVLSRNIDYNFYNSNLSAQESPFSTDIEFQKTALNASSIQPRTTLFILFLIFLLSLGLSIGLYYQRKGKRELAKRHAIIIKQSEKLETLDKAKSRFYANVSHELRTPLSLITGPLSTVLKESNLTQRQSKLLDIANDNGKLLRELITEILDLAKLEMGKMKLEEEPTDLNALFHGYCSQFESLANLKKLDFKASMPQNENFIVNLDQGKFRQILYNLLSNAFKFTVEGECVEAILTVKSGTLLLEVYDTGQGIHPDDLPHVFDRYFQTTKPDKPAEGGTGIGLALCNEYAHLFGGKMEVKSTLKKGAIFRITFPVTIVEGQQSLEDIAAKIDDGLEDVIGDDETDNLNIDHTVPATGNKPTILIVEDNLAQQEYLDLILSGSYNIVLANNGRGAYDYLEKNEVCDLILSDLMMPQMDGYQLLEKLKSEDRTRHIPVIMLTGRADVVSKLKALRIGVDDYLIKPYDEDELLARIENLLKNQAGRNIENQTADEQEISTPTFSKSDTDWLKTFEDYIRDHLNDNTITVPLLATEFAMSESSLLRQLKRLTGLTPNRYLQEMRLNEARQFLENGTYKSVTRVAHEVGFNDHRTFLRSFKRRFGKLPSDFLS